MKKSRLILFVLIIVLLIYILPNVLAQTPEYPTSLEGDAGKILNAANQIKDFKDTNLSSEFLKKQWGDLLLKNNVTGPFMKAINATSPFFNPIFKYTIGLEPSLTFLFFLTLAIWIALVSATYRTTNLASILSKRSHIIFAFGLIIIISIFGITKAIAEFIINLLEKMQTWWIKLIVITIIIALLIINQIIAKIIWQN